MDVGIDVVVDVVARPRPRRRLRPRRSPRFTLNHHRLKPVGFCQAESPLAAKAARGIPGLEPAQERRRREGKNFLRPFGHARQAKHFSSQLRQRVFLRTRTNAGKGAWDLPASALFLSAPGIKRAAAEGTLQHRPGKHV
jgi:hypothetical protein